ncbi:MAG TPA: transporter substrate-binding domain-containing protein [Candidatus Phocaeicola gallistercoris]|nr:transporter substrate-binding domain-containing protein [Candidatus Phocaeicola gallistercoris]
MIRKKTQYAISIIAIIIGIVWINTIDNPSPKSITRDYPAIKESGILHAVTEYNTISYHVQGNTIQGFDYELLHAFSKEKKLKLEVTPEMSYEKRIEGVTKGKYDILATGTVITSPLKDSLLFTHTLLLSKQVLIQRKKKPENDSTFIQNQLDLANKKIYTIKGSPAVLRLHNLMNEIADTIYIEEIDMYGPEQLLAMVAGEDIDYAVCDLSIAQKLITDFPNLDIKLDIGFTQFYAWGVNKHAPALLDSLNEWLTRFQKTDEYKQLYKRYFN